MKAIRAALLIAALFFVLILVPTASADCPKNKPDCPLEPPQSVEVDPDPIFASGQTNPLGGPRVIKPVEVSAPMPAPKFIDPLPLMTTSQSQQLSSPSSGAGDSQGGGSGGTSIKEGSSNLKAGVSGIGTLVMAAAAAGAAIATAPRMLGSFRTGSHLGTSFGLRSSGSLIRTGAAEVRPGSPSRPWAGGQSKTGHTSKPSSYGFRSSSYRGSTSGRERGEEEAEAQFQASMIPRARWIPGGGGSSYQTGSTSPPLPTPNRTPEPPRPPASTPTPTPNPERPPTPLPSGTPSSAQLEAMIAARSRGTWTAQREAAIIRSVGKTGTVIRKFGGAEISDSRLTTTVYGVQRVITETGKGVGTTVKRITEIPSRRQSLGLKGTLGNIWDSTGGRVTKSISRVVGGISSRAQALRGSIGNSWNAARRTIAASGKSVASAISQVRQAKNLRQAASSLINSIRSGVGGAIKNISGRIVGGVSGLARQVRQVGNVGAKVGNALKSLAGRINSIRKPPTNPSFRASLNMVGGAGGLVSLAGNIGYAATGNPGWRDVADTGSVVTSATNLVGLRGTIIKAVQSVSSSAPKVAEQAATTISTASKVAAVAVKCTGVLAMAMGAVTVYTEGKKIAEDYQRNGGRLSEAGKISVVKGVTGVATVIGGGLLLTPFAPIGGAILAVSGIASAITWGYENRDRLWQGLKSVGGAIKNAGTAITAINKRVNSKISTVAKSVTKNIKKSVKNVLGNLFGEKRTPTIPSTSQVEKSATSFGSGSSSSSRYSARKSRHFKRRTSRRSSNGRLRKNVRRQNTGSNRRRFRRVRRK